MRKPHKTTSRNAIAPRAPNRAHNFWNFLGLVYPYRMGALPNWQCFMVCPDEAAATPVVEYLGMHDCPALVFFVPPRFDFLPAVEIRVPAEFLNRARHIWTHAGALTDLTEAELEYLATGKLPAAAADPRRHDDAA
jgi:hypothetical protein